MRWSNDVYVSTPHRVQPPSRERYSIAFFLDPNPEALVSALPTCVAPGQAPRHPPVTAAEHLRQRLSATYKPASA
jgi:isopenicillin N synthase-like dioxygenase